MTTKRPIKPPTSEELDLILGPSPSQPTPTAIQPQAPEPAPAPAPAPVSEIVRKPEMPLPPIALGTRGFEPHDLDAAQRLAKLYLAGGAVPKQTLTGTNSPMEAIARVVCIIEAGRALGIGARESLTNISFIQGKLAIWGDLLVALVSRHPECEGIETAWKGKGDELVASVTVKRRGRDPVRWEFGVAMAKKAGLWGKPGPWQQYPERMLQMRARAFAVRDAFPDALLGLAFEEEVADYSDEQKPETYARIEAKIAKSEARQGNNGA